MKFNRLNMGCGFKKMQGYWNVDAFENCNPDEVFDFESTLWPWVDDSVERIHANNCLEHLGQSPKQFLNILKEMYRISKDGCLWDIIVPHHRCDVQWNDFTHVRVITPSTFELFNQEKNIDTMNSNFSDSVFGLMYNMDLEVKDVKYDLTHLFSSKENTKHPSGHSQIDIDLNTLCNVAQSLTIKVQVHKPERYPNFLKNKNLKK